MDRQQEWEGAAAVFVGSKGVVRKNEFVRAIADVLYSLDYTETAKMLEDESGISLHTSEMKSFIEEILDGQLDESVARLHQIDLMDETSIKSASSVILERDFFELLAGEEVMHALQILRSGLLPLDKVRELCSFLVSPSRMSPHGTLGQGSRLPSRKELLEELKALLPPSVMFPENRLVRLVEQGVEFENETCLLHNSPIGNTSLLAHQDCGMDQIPNRTVQVLQEHKGGVWFLKFSHNGKYLASSCSNCLVIIWEVEVDGHVSLKHRLSGHEKPVTYISWRYDDNQLLTCGEEETVRRWEVASGECQHVYRINGNQPHLGLVSCEWALDGKSIFSGVNDKRIIHWDPEGKEVEFLPGLRTRRISDLCITSDGKELITFWDKNRILLVELRTNSTRFIIGNQPIVCFTLSEDNQSLLVSLLDQRLELWNTDGPNGNSSEFRGHKRTRFVVRSCFGGVKERFIASGSEDSQVYIWNRKGSSTPISKLVGHTGVVNCVSWNPADPHMLASGSDDRTIRIWGVTTKCSINFSPEATTSTS